MVRILTPEEIAQSNLNRPMSKDNAMKGSGNLEFPSELLINSKIGKDIPVISSESQIKTTRSTFSLNPQPKVETVTTQSKGNAEDAWVRQEMVSKNILYTEEVFLRPLTISILKRLTNARASNSFTGMLDALQDCINIDIRDLTVPDLYFMMYWLRVNSYPKSPLTITWTSKYGNENVTRITEVGNFNFIELKMTKFELQKWQEDYGITIPNVRCMEAAVNPELSDSDSWEIRYGQYMYLEGELTPDYMDRKIAKLNEAGPDILAKIDEFSDLMDHGVEETVSCADQHFDIDKAMESLTIELDNLGLLLQSLQKALAVDVQTSNSIIGIVQRMDDIQTLFMTLQSAKENGTEIKPDKEVVNIGTADINILFP